MRVIEPNEGTFESLPLLEGFGPRETERLVIITDEFFTQIWSEEKPIAVWGIFLMRKKIDGKFHYGVTHYRLPRSSDKRIGIFRDLKDAMVVGGTWLESDGETFAYAITGLIAEYLGDKKSELFDMIRELLEKDFNGRVLLIDDAGE